MDAIADITSRNEDKTIDIKVQPGVAGIFFTSHSATKGASIRVYLSNCEGQDEAYTNTLYVIARGLAQLLVNNWNDVLNIGYQELVKENGSSLENMEPAGSA